MGVVGFGVLPPTIENQMEKKVENGMEAWGYVGVCLKSRRRVELKRCNQGLPSQGKAESRNSES